MCESEPVLSRRGLLGGAALGAVVGVPALQVIQDGFAGAAGTGGELPTRADYLLAEEVAYLNHASIGSVPRIVHDAHVGYLSVCETNPWLYMWGDAWTAALATTREAAAGMLGCGPEEVAITRNTTEGFNLLARGLPLEAGDEVLCSNLNHAGATRAWQDDGARRGYTLRRFDLPLARIPELTLEELVDLHVEAIGAKTRVLVFPHVDNTFGVRHPVAEIARAAKEAGVEFVAVDAAQTLGATPTGLAEALDVDAVLCSPHKWVESPKGVGLAFLRSELQERLEPLVTTWGQRSFAGTVRRFEDYGTRDLPAVLALGDALRLRNAQGIERVAVALEERVQDLSDRVADREGLDWRGPTTLDGRAGVAAIGLPVRHRALEVATGLWQRFGVVVRGFEADGINHLRVSPGLATDADRDHSALFEALGELGVA